MKKTILCTIVALVAAICSVHSSAQELKVLTSNVSGFSCSVPQQTNATQDNEEAVIYMTPDQEFLVTAIPIDGEQATEEVIATILNTMADAADMDLTKAETIDLDSKTISGMVMVQKKEESNSISAVGLIGTTEGDQGFFITIVMGANYIGCFDTVLHSIHYDGTAVE